MQSINICYRNSSLCCRYDRSTFIVSTTYNRCWSAERITTASVGHWWVINLIPEISIDWQALSMFLGSKYIAPKVIFIYLRLSDHMFMSINVGRQDLFVCLATVLIPFFITRPLITDHHLWIIFATFFFVLVILLQFIVGLYLVTLVQLNISSLYLLSLLLLLQVYSPFDYLTIDITLSHHYHTLGLLLLNNTICVANRYFA